jgi:hypothetical protein
VTQAFITLATSPIAVYLDEVYLGSTLANSVNLCDMQRRGAARAAGNTLGEECHRRCCRFHHCASDVDPGYSGRGAWIEDLAPDGPRNLDAYNKSGGRLWLEWSRDTALEADPAEICREFP